MIRSVRFLSPKLACNNIIRAFVATSPEGIISQELLQRVSNKKPNSVYHIYSTRVRIEVES